MTEFGAPVEEEFPDPFSDDSLAASFAALHVDGWRYVAQWNRWFNYRTGVWLQDSTLHVWERAREVCREAASQPENARRAGQITSAKTISAVERLARSDRRLAATTDQWDADQMVLNTPGGVIELQTGAFRLGRPEDYCTRQTAVTPGGGAPLWLRFLERITNGDRDLIAYLQRVAGYALTGSIREHVLVFGYGTGRNGKGTFLHTLRKVMGSYADVAPTSTFTASPGDRHPTELAMLRGARLIVGSETESGRRWDEARIKSLTGGDPITARFMRQDFFTYMPQFKLFIIGNHKPAIRDVDEAIKARVHLVPFTVTIPPDERDTQLDEKLVPEWPGILQWAIEGCREWLEVGRLCPPPAVVDATNDYLSNEDALQTWLSERCRVRDGLEGRVAILYQSWQEWAEAAGEPVGSMKAFSQRMDGKGFERVRLGHTQDRGFRGVCVELRGQADRSRHVS